MVAAAASWSTATQRNRIRLIGQLVRPLFPPSAHVLPQGLHGVVELLAAAARQVIFLLVEQAIGEGVLTGCMRCGGYVAQVSAADDAVLMVTEQGLDRFGRRGNLGPVDGGGDVAKAFGLLTGWCSAWSRSSPSDVAAALADLAALRRRR